SSRMIDVLRKQKRVSAREFGTDTLPEPQVSSRAHDGAEGIDARRLSAALEALPERQRDIVRALKLEDKSVKDVSAELGMSPSAVKVAAHRGYKALRRLLGDKES